MASRLKLIVMSSTIGFSPAIAAPMPAPVITDSAIGVSFTRRGPNSSRKPFVTAYEPPYAPMSSPMRKTRSSFWSCQRRACRIASR